MHLGHGSLIHHIEQTWTLCAFTLLCVTSSLIYHPLLDALVNCCHQILGMYVIILPVVPKLRLGVGLKRERCQSKIVPWITQILTYRIMNDIFHKSESPNSEWLGVMNVSLPLSDLTPDFVIMLEWEIRPRAVYLPFSCN